MAQPTSHNLQKIGISQLPNVKLFTSQNTSNIVLAELQNSNLLLDCLRFVLTTFWLYQTRSLAAKKILHVLYNHYAKNKIIQNTFVGLKKIRVINTLRTQHHPQSILFVSNAGRNRIGKRAITKSFLYRLTNRIGTELDDKSMNLHSENFKILSVGCWLFICLNVLRKPKIQKKNLWVKLRKSRKIKRILVIE